MLISFTACSQNLQDGTQKVDLVECMEPTSQPKWLGKSFNEVITLLGEPSDEETFTMGDGVITEFRGNLDILLPRDIPENRAVKVKEAHWPAKNEADCVLTLWFKLTEDQWTAIDSLLWHKDMEF
jgi:hypothetical protein